MEGIGEFVRVDRGFRGDRNEDEIDAGEVELALEIQDRRQRVARDLRLAGTGGPEFWRDQVPEFLVQKEPASHTRHGHRLGFFRAGHRLGGHLPKRVGGRADFRREPTGPKTPCGQSGGNRQPGTGPCELCHRVDLVKLTRGLS